MICPKCGAEVKEGTNFCVACGNPVEVAEAAPEVKAEVPVAPPVAPVYYPPVQKELTKEELPAKFKPLGAWAYFGYQLLFCIPLVGFILLIIFSLSDDNINRRNFARSYWCSFVVGAVIAVFILVFILILGINFMDIADEMMYY